MSGDIIKNTPGEESKKPRNIKKYLLPLTIALVVIVAVLSLFIYIYSSKDHSIYSVLTNEKYNQNGISFSFDYPLVAKSNSKLLSKLSNTNTVAVYSYSVNKNQSLGIAIRYFDISDTLKLLNLSPSQLLNQIKNNFGDYVDLINKKDPSTYSKLYGNCTNYVTNINGNNNLVCTSESKGITTVEIIGVTSTKQYTLYLVMPDSIWNSHQKVWQKVEKSFTY